MVSRCEGPAIAMEHLNTPVLTPAAAKWYSFRNLEMKVIGRSCVELIGRGDLSPLPEAPDVASAGVGHERRASSSLAKGRYPLRLVMAVRRVLLQNRCPE